MSTQVIATLSLLWTLFVLFVLIPAVLIGLGLIFRKGSRRLKKYTLFGCVGFYLLWALYLWNTHLFSGLMNVQM